MRYYKGEGQMGPRGPQGPRGPPGPRGSTGSAIFNQITNENIQQTGFFQVINQGFCMEKTVDGLENQPEIIIDWDNDINDIGEITKFITINEDNNLLFHEKGIYSIVFRFHFFLSEAPIIFSTGLGGYKHLERRLGLVLKCTKIRLLFITKNLV